IIKPHNFVSDIMMQECQRSEKENLVYWVSIIRCASMSRFPYRRVFELVFHLCSMLMKAFTIHILRSLG
ncbi:MAG: hypothetical protein ACE5PV_24795, partial [Candidatus Poribacteria bacterium]